MKRSAVLIGIEHYEDPAFPAAEYAESDVSDLASWLRRVGGYDFVSLRIGPRARELLDAVAAATAALAPGDLLLIYFAGHAVTVDGKPVLICRDARASRVAAFQDAVPVELLFSETGLPGLARVFVFDTARATASAGGVTGFSADSAASLRQLAQTRVGGMAPLAFLGASASDVVQPAIGARRRGAFAAALLDELTDARRSGRSPLLNAAFEAGLAQRMSATGLPPSAAPWLISSGIIPLCAEIGGAVELAVGADGVAAEPMPLTAIRCDPIRWHGFSPEYREVLLRSISRNAALLYGTEAEGVDGAALFEAGLAREIEWRNGVPMAVLEWAALIAAGRRDEIRKCLAAGAANGEQDDLPYLLRLYYEQGDLTRARYELDKAHGKGVWLEPALLLIAGFRDAVVGRRYLAECSAWAGKDTRFLTTCARAWHALFGDNREAARCLETAEQRALDSQDFEWLAAGAADFFQDTRSAWRHLGRAESVAACARDWMIAAAGWMRLFCDRREAARCADRAERSAVAARDWIACATGWRELLDDAERARENLAIAEKLAREVWEWHDCAERWLNLFNDEGRARRCLTLAEQAAQHFGEWRDCASAWRRLLNETAEARQCLLEAEHHASDALDWDVLSGDWHDLLKDDREAERCRAQAERLRLRR